MGSYKYLTNLESKIRRCPFLIFIIVNKHSVTSINAWRKVLKLLYPIFLYASYQILQLIIPHFHRLNYITTKNTKKSCFFFCVQRIFNKSSAGTALWNRALYMGELRKNTTSTGTITEKNLDTLAKVRLFVQKFNFL